MTPLSFGPPHLQSIMSKAEMQDSGTPNRVSSPGPLKILAICNIDLMAWVLLKQWLIGLQEAGYEVHIACAGERYMEALSELGFYMHPISIRRTFWPLAHFRPVFELWKIIRDGNFSAINTHSAVGAGVGRIAALLAGSQLTIYTVHGFLFHENMPAIPRWFLISMEWLLGRTTAGFMFVSEEDNRTAAATGIAPPGVPAMSIFNGVDLDAFSPVTECPHDALRFKRDLGIEPDTPVIGIVGRIVREKGYLEFLEMASMVIRHHRAVFLVVGDTLPSDRDQFGNGFRNEVARAGMTSHFLFTGQTTEVPKYLRIMTMFVLPSWREGFPRSIVEAMSCGLPVIATNIRGCREAVVHEQTGLIVPLRDSAALAEAVERLLENPRMTTAMGRVARKRAVELYDYRMVQQRFVRFVDGVVHRRDAGTGVAA
jgi:glycosyltransferase involved in cell wall biosynthesis